MPTGPFVRFRLGAAPRSLLALGAAVPLLILFTGAGCKPKRPSCDPGSVKWGVQLAIDTSTLINLDPDGRALPTVIRLYRMRGELAAEDIDFMALWRSEKPNELGDNFLSMEEITVRPDTREVRDLPIERDATHLLAAALFREPVGTSWFGTYAIPVNHADVVCAKEPASKAYPEPCFFVYVDRNSLSAGPTPPSGFTPIPTLQCAPLGATAEPPEEPRKWWQLKKRNKVEENLQDPLRANDVDTPRVPQTQTPQTPQPRTPQTPQVPNKPQAPKAPTKPSNPLPKPK